MIAPLSANITLIVAICCSCQWFDIMAMMLACFVAPALVYWSLEWLRRLISDLKLLFNSKLRKEFDAVRSM